ncbi:pyridoxamine 5'-phosphate oxidase family protein [Streptomyces sp. SudanB182_2057]|uniref:pyridoxamine 5'-phosphate oxidase family protein n=1 Tax=Streptomyces sp. SudanB182_2057 TaxID=3035281 RepID=UPI003F57606F
MTHYQEPSHRRVDLDQDEALRLLGSVSLGRVVFTRQALPAVRPVRHVLDNGDVVVLAHDAAALAPQALRSGDEGVIVAYEADAIDPDTHLGWSVVVTGYAQLVSDPAELGRLYELSWPEAAVEGGEQAVRIHPELVTGVLVTESGGAARAAR